MKSHGRALMAWWGIGATAPAAVVLAQSPAARVPSVMAFVNVSVVPMDSARVLAGQTVVVRDNQISVIGPVKTVAVPAGATRIDGTGKFLIPGLADMHAHLMHFPQVDDSVYDVDQLLFLFAANGVTTIRNMDHAADVGLRQRKRATAEKIWSPRIYTSGRLPIEGGLGNARSYVEQVAAYKTAGYDFIKLYFESLSQRDSIIAAARQVGIPFLGHVPKDTSGAYVLEHALNTGYASVEHLYGYLEYLTDGRLPPQPTAGDGSEYWVNMRQQVDRSRIPLVAAATRRAGVWNCPTMLAVGLAALGWNRIPDSVRQWPELRYVRIQRRQWWPDVHVGPGPEIQILRQVVKALQDSGAGLLLGADASVPYIVPGFSIHRELQALVQAGLTPYQALAAGTRNAAVYFKTMEESGTIDVGKRADLVLLNGNPLVDIRNTRQPAGVMLGGRWLSRSVIDRRLAEIEAAYAVTP